MEAHEMAPWQIADVAKHLQCSEATVRRSMRDRGLPYCRFGRLVRFQPLDVDRWLQQQLVTRSMR